MNQGLKVLITYSLIIILGVFLFMSARWYSYRTPKVERHTYEKSIERGDPLLKRFKNKPKEGMVYYQSVEVTTTDSAGAFPFLADTKRDTMVTIWSRPFLNEYK
mgnify:CR=1 FL=1